MSEQDRQGREAANEGRPGIHLDDFDRPGDAACWAHLVCPACGAVISEGHRAGCDWNEADSPDGATA